MLTSYFSNIKFESKFWDNPPKRKRSWKESRTEWLTDRQWDSDKVYSLSPYFRFNRLKFMSGHINFSSWNYYIEILMKGLILLSFDLSGGDRLHQITWGSAVRWGTNYKELHYPTAEPLCIQTVSQWMWQHERPSCIYAANLRHCLYEPEENRFPVIGPTKA